MKKISMIFALLCAFAACSVLMSCASTGVKYYGEPMTGYGYSPAWVSPEDFGDGSESGIAIDGFEMPDGRTLTVRFFAPTVEECHKMFEYIAEIEGVPQGEKWYKHHDIDLESPEAKNLLTTSADVDYEDFYRHTFNNEDFPEIANFMKEKGLPFAVGIEREGNKVYLFQIAPFHQIWGKLLVQYVVLIDEATFKERQAKKIEERQAEMVKKDAARSAAIQKMLADMQTSKRTIWLWHLSTVGASTGLRGVVEQGEIGFWYRIVYNDGTYSYCISKERQWYLQENATGRMKKLDSIDVPAQVRSLAD